MERTNGGSGRFFLKLVFICGNFMLFTFAENDAVEFFTRVFIAAKRVLIEFPAERSLEFALEKASLMDCLMLLRSSGIVDL
ncbi:MAG: hypothetical protein NWE95_12005 [Candidatus Bathyarchaeota archaeon]|nr:hypothetical protein [Candidatus Bathyarchaeota archaeon]